MGKLIRAVLRGLEGGNALRLLDLESSNAYPATCQKTIYSLVSSAKVVQDRLEGRERPGEDAPQSMRFILHN
jgi:hypothetical protein